MVVFLCVDICICTMIMFGGKKHHLSWVENYAKMFLISWEIRNYTLSSWRWDSECHSVGYETPKISRIRNMGAKLFSVRITIYRKYNHNELAIKHSHTSVTHPSHLCMYYIMPSLVSFQKGASPRKHDENASREEVISPRVTAIQIRYVGTHYSYINDSKNGYQCWNNRCCYYYR